MSQTIIRGKHDKENPYFMMSRDTAQDRRLSYEARGLLAYLLSKSGDWKLKVDDLVQDAKKGEGKAGRDKIYAILDELAACGYVKKAEKYQAKNGKWCWTPYEVFEVPCPEKPYTEKPYTVNPDTLENTENESKEYIASDDAQRPAAQDETPKRKPHKNALWHDALVLAFGVTPTNLTKTADGLYWKIAAELAKINFPVDKIGDLYRYVKTKSQKERWSSFTVSALSKYAPSYLATLQPKAPTPEPEYPAEWYPRTDDYLPLDAFGNWIGAKS
jgi:hypothetical protein